MPGDVSIARRERIFGVIIPAGTSFVSWYSLLSTQQKADLAIDGQTGALQAVDGFIVNGSATDTIQRIDDVGDRTTDIHAIPPGASWQMPVENWLVKSNVRSLSGSALACTLIVYIQ